MTRLSSTEPAFGWNTLTVSPAPMLNEFQLTMVRAVPWVRFITWLLGVATLSVPDTTWASVGRAWTVGAAKALASASVSRLTRRTGVLLEILLFMLSSFSEGKGSAQPGGRVALHVGLGALRAHAPRHIGAERVTAAVVDAQSKAAPCIGA